VKCPKCRSDSPSDTLFCGKCGTKFDAGARVSCTQTLGISTDGLSRGTIFAGRYEVIEELGTGGMGKVFRAFDKKMDEEVALKLIKSEIAADKQIVERFRNEIKIARKITHKNVCRMHDLNEDGQNLYLTMEYVRGEDLKGLIRRTKRLAPETAVFIVRQIADGLTEAHKLGIVHRDLKPQNIMIDKEGNAKIMDFGIARSLHTQGRTGEKAVIGTPEYMSPEQVEGKETDPRSDIYSLGIILYEMVTGRVPFEGHTPFSIGLKHKTEIPKDPKTLNPQVSDDLNRVILRCLEKDKEKRYQDLADVDVELERIDNGPPAREQAGPGGKTPTSKQVTVSFNPKKMIIPALAVAGLIAAVIFTGVLSPKKNPPTGISHPIISVAVLPFVDLSPKKDYEYLCEGIPETLITALTKIKDLRVPARTSAFSFKGKDGDIGEIGRALSVNTVLRGSVQVIGDRIRVTPRLINVEDGNYLWSESYNRKFEEVFAIQDDIAREIIKALKITLLGEQEAPLVKNYTENLQAYNQYLQGRFFANQRTGESLNQAIAFFNQAVDMDPKYAPAYVGLADCYILLPQYTKSSTREGLTKSRAAVSKALEIDDELADAHATSGLILAQEWKWGEAEREFQRAIGLNPNYASAYLWYALLLRRLGRLDEGLVKIQRAVELDPLSPLMNVNLGRHLYVKKEYDLAIQQYHKTLRLNPNFALARMRLGEAYRQKGLLKEATAELQMARKLFGENPLGFGELGNAYALSGDKDKATEELTKLMELSKQGYSLNYDIAFVYLGLGDQEKSLEWLDRAVKENEVNAQYLKVAPGWENLRSDPRFKSLLRIMNLE